MTLSLSSGDVEAIVAPEQGCEVRSLRFRGTELLFQAPWAPAPVPTAPASAEDWEACWRGGWQILLPNSGEPCTVDGRRHGFHGDASIAPWDVLDAGPAGLLAAWTDADGLVAERSVEVRPNGVRVRTEVVNSSGAPQGLVPTEHLVLGGPLAGEDAEIELAGGTVAPQTWNGEPDGPVAPWPAGFDRLDGRPFSRFGVVRDVAGRRAVVRGGGITLTLGFTHPHLWLWQEGGGAMTAPWLGTTACLAIEPSYCASADGLAAALARGEAIVLEPGASTVTHLEIGVA